MAFLAEKLGGLTDRDTEAVREMVEACDRQIEGEESETFHRAAVGAALLADLRAHMMRGGSGG